MISLETAQKNYEENIKRIPWNANTEKNLRDAKNLQNNTINEYLPIFVNQVEQQARNVSGVARQRQNAQSAVNTSINILKSIPNDIDSRIAKIDIGGIQNKINEMDSQIAAEKAKQSKSNEILEIRKEQYAALEKKYSANLHSSWLGLWRPLQDNTHVGLNVASAMFGVLGLLTIGYLAYGFFTSGAPVTATGTSAGANADISSMMRNGAKNIAAALSGGFRKVKRS
jgi:hypothetical protein